MAVVRKTNKCLEMDDFATDELIFAETNYEIED
jgi:hypothetical protein